jgi:GTP1/Obg family GTP-binding protein
MSTFNKASIAHELESNAEWRRDKAVEYANDIRNTHAAEIFEQLLDQVERIKDDHPLINRLNATYEELIELVGSNANNDLSNVVDEVNEYHRDIGFHCFPEFIEDYIKGLLEIYERLLRRAKQNQKILENRVRRKAKRLGFRVLKSRQPIHLHNFGEYQLVEDNVVLLGRDFNASLDDIEDFLTHQVPA